MDDLISRQAAIDIFDDYNVSVENGELEAYSRDRKRLCELPSAQPEKRTEEHTETHACDCISRQAAIDLFPDDDLEWDTKGGYIAPHLARQMICELPSAQPDTKPIEYEDCANAMMRMWIDNVVTDGEYNRIMDKLNAHWRKTKNGRFNQQAGGD